MDTTDAALGGPRLATLGQRVVAQALDAVVYLIALFVLPMVAMIVSGTPAGVSLGLVFAVLYLLFQDGLRRGQSYGKRLVNIAVMDERTGEWCTFGQSLVRNLTLVVLGIVDWVFALGPRRQRLGDRLAHTVVVQLDSSADEPLPWRSA